MAAAVKHAKTGGTANMVATDVMANGDGESTRVHNNQQGDGEGKGSDDDDSDSDTFCSDLSPPLL
jgi:hypothetical protein